LPPFPAKPFKFVSKVPHHGTTALDWLDFQVLHGLAWEVGDISYFFDISCSKNEDAVANTLGRLYRVLD